jgi:Dolichyl-phosphate-mannose-protein mannosyltransferase
MSGPFAAILALALFAFEPNLLAHGNLVTTDMAASLFFFSTAYAFYRYAKRRSVGRLAVVCLSAGLGMAAKHSMIFIFPALVLVALVELVLPAEEGQKRKDRTRQAMQLAASLVIVGAAAFAILWVFYGFRYAARPAGHAMIPPLAGYSAMLEGGFGKKMLTGLSEHHVLPESYLYGWVDILSGNHFLPCYIFGKLYSTGRWFYFPGTLIIKSTLGFLLLLMVALTGFWRFRTKLRREFLFLVIPAGFYLLVAIASQFNIGVRHILPVYPFLIVFAAVGAGTIVESDRRWLVAIVVLVALHMASSLRAFPNYISYANEIWGGPTQTYKVLTDSSVDWGQQLKDVEKYLDAHAVKDCWFDYFAQMPVNPSYYQIKCRSLPDAFASLLSMPAEVIPPHVDGTVLISATELAGTLWGPDELNPYAQFGKLTPDAVIDGGVLVFYGQFDVPLAAANSHALNSSQLLRSGKPEEALEEAQVALTLAPTDVRSQITLGNALSALKRNDEARAAYQDALSNAQKVFPEFRGFLIPFLNQKLSGNGATPGR